MYHVDDCVIGKEIASQAEYHINVYDYDVRLCSDGCCFEARTAAELWSNDCKTFLTEDVDGFCNSGEAAQKVINLAKARGLNVHRGNTAIYVDGDRDCSNELIYGLKKFPLDY